VGPRPGIPRPLLPVDPVFEYRVHRHGPLLCGLRPGLAHDLQTAHGAVEEHRDEPERTGLPPVRRQEVGTSFHAGRFPGVRVQLGNPLPADPERGGLMQELYKKYRPTNFVQVIGQDEVVSVLSGFVRKKNVPHCLLFTGPNGTGKTSLAELMARKVGCSPKVGVVDVNCALADPMDTVREIARSAEYKAFDGGNRCWIL